MSHEVPLPQLLVTMKDVSAGWADEALLHPCLEYALQSKYVVMPSEFLALFSEM